MIEQRDLLLVPFPFSVQSGQKVRPVVVISKNAFNQFSDDVITVAITSNTSKGPYNVLLSPDDVEEGNLRHMCCIKVESILKIDKKLIVKKIGKIKLSLFQETIKILFSIMR